MEHERTFLSIINPFISLTGMPAGFYIVKDPLIHKLGIKF